MKINFSDQPFIYDKNSIFLAGPTTRKSLFENSWRKKSCDYLSAVLRFNGTVYVPEFENSIVLPDLTAQAGWEKEGLMNAGAIVFYMCRKMPENPGLSSNVEFGMYLVKRPANIVLCLPEHGEKNSYIEWQYHDHNPYAPVYRTLEEALAAAADMASGKA